MIKLDQVRFSYDEQSTILDGIDLSIGAGEIVAIVGPSGCGKSTLLALVAGLLSPSEGSLSVQTEPGQHPLAMVFQGETLLPWKSVADNVAVSLRWKGISKRVARETVGPLLKMVGLEQTASKYPAHLSGGMRRRAQFLCAMAAQPTILLLDEPFSAVDEPTRVQIHQDVSTVLRHYKTTAVLVTHDLAEAISLSDRTIMLTATPAHIHTEFVVPFGPNRDMLSLRRDPLFLKLYGELWTELSGQMKPRSTVDVESANISPD